MFGALEKKKSWWQHEKKKTNTPRASSAFRKMYMDHKQKEDESEKRDAFIEKRKPQKQNIEKWNRIGLD